VGEVEVGEEQRKVGRRPTGADVDWSSRRGHVGRVGRGRRRVRKNW